MIEQKGFVFSILCREIVVINMKNEMGQNESPRRIEKLSNYVSTYLFN